MLCRGPEVLPRAKSRALGKDALCRGPDTRALGKERPSAKRPRPSAKTGPRQIKSLPRAEGRGPRQRCPRQIRPVGSRRPFPVKLCRGPPVRPSAKVFFPVKPGYSAKKKFKSLPRALDQALGKDFFKTSFLAKIFFL